MVSTIDRHTFTAQISTSFGALEVQAASLSLDEGWSPFVQGTLTCVAPSGAELEEVDPRNGVRVHATATRKFGGSDPVSVLSTAWDGLTAADLSTRFGGMKARDITVQHYYPWNSFGVRLPSIRSFNLAVRSRRIGHRAGTMVLTVASDEALLQDYALVDTQPYVPALSSVRSVVGAVLAKIGRVLVGGTADGTIDPAASIWSPGVDGWSYVTPLVQAANLRLWADEQGLFHLTDSGYVPDGVLVLSATGTITDAEDSIDRDGDDWYDAVVVSYQWTDDLGVQQTKYDVASVPGFSKVKTLSFDRPYPGPGAAAGVLYRAIGRGRAVTPSAVSDYDATPGIATIITLDDTPIQTGYLSSVSWSWPQAEMNAKTRGLVDTPPTAWTFLPSDETWLDSPTGASWLDETIGA